MNRLIIKRIKIEHRTEKHYKRKNNHNAADDTVDYNYAAVVKLVTHLVDKPCQPEPPQQGAADYAEIPHTHIKRLLRDDKSKLGKGCHEKEHYQRIGECHKKGCYAVVYQCAFLVAADVYLLGRIGTITVYAEAHQHHAARYLKYEPVVIVVHQVHYEAHSKPRYHGVNQVTDRSTYTCDKAIPSSLVERPLDTEHPHRPHWSRSNDTYQYSFKDPVEYV